MKNKKNIGELVKIDKHIGIIISRKQVGKLCKHDCSHCKEVTDDETFLYLFFKRKQTCYSYSSITKHLNLLFKKQNDLVKLKSYFKHKRSKKEKK